MRTDLWTRRSSRGSRAPAPVLRRTGARDSRSNSTPSREEPLERRPYHGTGQLARLGTLLWIVLASCQSVDSSGIDPPVPVPACRDIAEFGNGQSCAATAGGAVDLRRCGVAATAACSPGRLCYDSPLFVACACVADADCAGRTEYVNTARAALGMTSLSPRCESGLCEADLDGAPSATSDASPFAD